MTQAALAAVPIPTPLAEEILDTLVHRIGKDAQAALPHDWLAATILTVRNDIIERWMASSKQAHADGAKRVYYLSLEFLIGRLLRDAIANLSRTDEVREALESLDKDREFLLAGGVFDNDQIDSYIELKMTEVIKFEHTPHPVEYEMYYSA